MHDWRETQSNQLSYHAEDSQSLSFNHCTLWVYRSPLWNLSWIARFFPCPHPSTSHSGAPDGLGVQMDTCQSRGAWRHCTVLLSRLHSMYAWPILNTTYFWLVYKSQFWKLSCVIIDTRKPSPMSKWGKRYRWWCGVFISLQLGIKIKCDK